MDLTGSYLGESTRGGRNVFEESGWVNRVITAGIIGMIGWTLLTVTEMAEEVAVMQARFESFETFATAQSLGRYTKSEASADLALLAQRIERLEEWNARLSDRINETEEHVDVLRGSR